MVIIKTVAADTLAALAALPQAAATRQFFTAGAAVEAIAAVVVTTAFAAAAALGAERTEAAVTGVGVLIGRRITAVRAQGALPFAQQDMGRVGVVGREDVAHDQAELGYP